MISDGDDDSPHPEEEEKKKDAIHLVILGRNGAIKTHRRADNTHNKETRCDAFFFSFFSFLFFYLFRPFLNETTRFVIFITGLKLSPPFWHFLFLSLQDGLVG
jgi:hypothetical protein